MPIASARNAASGSRTASSVMSGGPLPPAQPFLARSWSRRAWPTSTRSPMTTMSANSAIGASGSAIDRHDRRCGLHPDLVLDRAADAHREVQLGLDDLAGLADLLRVRDPARVDRGARGADGPAELRCEVIEQGEALRAADPATAGHDDPGVVDRGGRALGRDPVDDRDGRLGQFATGRSPTSTDPGAAAGSAVTVFGRIVTIPRPLGQGALGHELAAEHAVRSPPAPGRHPTGRPRWRAPPGRSAPRARPRGHGPPGLRP